MNKEDIQAAQAMDQEAQQTVHFAVVVEQILAEPGGAVNVQTGQENNKQRFYVENKWEHQWNNLHHLIDVEDGGSQKSTLKIIQMANTADDLTSITLERNEVDALLHILLKWRMKYLDPSEELKKVDAEMDDHLF